MYSSTSTVYYQRITTCAVGRALSITQPNGGEVYEPGQTVPIQWAAAGTGWQPGDKVSLEYSSDSGAGWSAIPGAVSLAYNAGSLQLGHCRRAESSQYKVRVVFNGDWSVKDASDADFKIIGCKPSVPTNPNPADGATGVPVNTSLSWGGSNAFYAEDFNDGLAQDWQPVVPAQWQVVSGEYCANTVAGGSLVSSTYAGATWADISFQATVRRTSGDAGYAVFRATSGFVPAASGSAYVVGIYPGFYNIFKQLSGPTAAIQPTTTSPYLNTGTQPNAVKISISGSTIKVFFNGNLAWSGPDPSISGAGRIGFVADGPSGQTALCYFDDVVVDAPVTSAPALSSEQEWYNAHPIAGEAGYEAPVGTAQAAPRELVGSSATGGVLATSPTLYDVYMGDSPGNLTRIATGSQPADV